jgi:nicotinamide mononucleotide transporter
VLESLRTALAGITAAEWIAVVFAFAYLVLAIRQNAWCWACSIVSSAIFLVLFARGGLVMQAWLQVFYVAMAVYGWWAWRRGGEGPQSALTVSRWPLRRHLVALVVIGVVSVVNGRWVAGGAHDALVPYVDALTAWVSVFATWLVARKVLENWLYWIVVDMVAAALYFTQGLHATAVLFVVYSLVAIRGYQQWRADYRREGVVQTSDVHA